MFLNIKEIREKISLFTPKDMGSIVDDFEKIIQFILNKEKILGSSQSFFSMQELSNLNSLLTKPIEIDLKRPSQKSYPSLHALNALLRLSGILRVTKTKKSVILSIDQKTYDSWKRLNSIEKYCQLFSILFLPDFEESLNESPGFGSCFWTLDRLMNQEVRHFSTYKEQQDFTYKSTHHFALFELLGWISIESIKPEPGKGWRFSSLRFTPFGKLIGKVCLKLLNSLVEQTDLMFLAALRNEIKPWLSPYFPEWKQDFIIHETPSNLGLHIFKVSLAGAWIRIAIQSEEDLDTFSSIILKAFNFDSDHLYYFAYQDHSGITRKIYHPYMKDKPLLADEYTVGALSLSIGQSLTFLFDFGDRWEFDVQLEQLNPENMKIKNLTILEKGGEPLPEQY